MASGYSVVLGPQYEEDMRETLNADNSPLAGVKVDIDIWQNSDGSMEYRLTVHNGSGRELSEVVFPDVELETRGGESGFTMPVGPGWWQPFEPLDEGESITWNYPVFGAMQWVDYGDKDSGIYIGTHDKTPYIKLCTVGKRNGRPWFRVRWTDIRLMPGETFELPPVVVWEHEGDWHTGARYYREWAETWMEKPSGAEWYNDAPAWCWCGMKGQHASRPNRCFSELPATSQADSEYGVRLANVASWMEHGHDTHYPDYWAGESMGGPEALIQAVNDIHSRGRCISMYTNGRIADPEGSIGKMENWQGWTCQAPSREVVAELQRLHANFYPGANPDVYWNTSGTVVTETYDKVDFAVMCPGSPEWREFFISRIETIARDYGADGTFIDQICGAWATPCYSDAHDHQRPNESWSGYHILLKELRSRLRAINPHFQMATEGVCDILGQFFDVQQGHNDWDTQVGTKSWPMPELYGYTFPWYTINTGWASRNSYYYLKLAHAVGSGIDICDLERDKTEERFQDYVRQIMAWRKQYVDYLFGGEFIGALGSSDPHYLAHAFEREGRVVATGAWVPYKVDPAKPASITLRLKNRTAKSAALSTEGGEREVSIAQDGPDALIRVPFHEIGALEVTVG